MIEKYEGPEGFEEWLRDYNKKLYKLGINPIEVDDEIVETE
jgi:hypothetical protein